MIIAVFIVLKSKYRAAILWSAGFILATFFPRVAAMSGARVNSLTFLLMAMLFVLWLWALPLARWVSLSAAALFALLHIQAGFQLTEIYANSLQNTHRLLKPLILDIKQHPGERYHFVVGDLGQMINWPYEIHYYLTNSIGRNSNIIVSGVAFSQRDSYNWKSFDIHRDAGLWKISIPNPNASIDTQLVRISKERFVRIEKCIPGQGKEFFSEVEFKLYNLLDGSRLFYTDGPQLFIGEYRTTEGFHRARF